MKRPQVYVHTMPHTMSIIQKEGKKKTKKHQPLKPFCAHIAHADCLFGNEVQELPCLKSNKEDISFANMANSNSSSSLGRPEAAQPQ